MAIRNLGSMTRQRGQVLILVLIALALGSLLITPMLRYVSTGLIEVPVSKELLLKQYAADAAVEYSLWQLKYNVDNITDQLNPENPSANTTITVNGLEVPVTTEITQSPLGEAWPFPVPLTESGIHLAAALEIRPPYWSGDGQIAYFKHVVYMYNYGTSEIHLKAVFQQLDPRFTYVAGSYEGPTADLTKTYVNDHWELYFDFTSPRPDLSEQEATFISFVAWTGGEIGDNTYSGSGWVEYAGFEEEAGGQFSGEYSPGSFGYYYDIIATSGSYTILVNVGITEEGEIVIRSYQIQF
ncbi:MAG: hypothetical protein ACE5LA_07520 [Dehalococcoidales bacterium]